MHERGQFTHTSEDACGMCGIFKAFRVLVREVRIRLRDDVLFYMRGLYDLCKGLRKPVRQ